MSHSKLRRSCFKPSRPTARHHRASDLSPVGRHSEVPCQGLAHGMAAGTPEMERTVCGSRAHSEVQKCNVMDTWEEEGAEIGPSRAHEARQHAEGRLLRQVHQDDARNKRHALTVGHLPKPPSRLECTAPSACLIGPQSICV